MPLLQSAQFDVTGAERCHGCSDCTDNTKAR